jgi:DNA polymerase III subunit epsilon
MRDYLLFVDTETSGLPRRWDLPYGVPGNWPYSVQIAWAVYSRQGELEKTENHYVSDDDFKMDPVALSIHGITRERRLREGKSRQEILTRFAADLEQYQPLVVAHFMQLDYHMLGADFNRIGRENPLQQYPVFCTMLATSKYVSNPRAKYLRLDRLYYVLFQRELTNQHDALTDARATAECFFEMYRIGDLNDHVIAGQHIDLATADAPVPPEDGGTRRGLGCAGPLIGTFILTVLISLWL